MKNIFVLAIMMFLMASNSKAQTVTIYRGGVATSPVYSTIAAAAAAILNGDSAVLSPHTFYEHNLFLPTGTVWKGTQTLVDSSKIDAEGKGGCAGPLIKPGLKRNVTIRDIIFERGEGGGLGSSLGTDTLKIKGYSIVRNCHSNRVGGGGTMFSYSTMPNSRTILLIHLEVVLVLYGLTIVLKFVTTHHAMVVQWVTQAVDIFIAIHLASVFTTIRPRWVVVAFMGMVR